MKNHFLLLLFFVTTLSFGQTIDYAEKTKTLSIAYANQSGSKAEIVKSSIEYADILRIQGRYKESISIALEAQKASLKLKKEGVTLQDDVQYLLGKFFYQSGNLPLADKIISRGLELAETSFPKNDWRRFRAMNTTGLMSIASGDFVKAEGYLTKAAQLIKESNGVPVEVKIQNNLYRGEYYRIKGSYAASEALLKLAFQQMKALPNNHEIVAEGNVYYARLYKELHNYAKAYKYLNSSDKFYTSFSANHPMLTSLSIEKGDLYFLADEKEMANELLKSNALTSARKGQKTIYFYDANRLEARNMTTQGQFREAERLYNELTDSIATYMGDRSLYNANFLHEKASFYYTAGKYEEALGTWQLVVDIQKDLIDNAHPSYIKAINGQALVYWAMKRNNLAANAFKKSAENYIEQFSKNFVFLNEKEKGLLYKDVRLFFDQYNRFILDDAMQNNGKSSLLTAMYENQLSSKAFLFKSSKDLNNYLNTTNDPLIKAKANSWLRGKEQLSKLYKLEEADLIDLNISLDSIETYVSNLEKEINLRTAINTNGTKNSLTWEEVKAALGEKEVAMEIMRISDFAPDSGGTKRESVYYVALIISKNSKYPELKVIQNGIDLETRIIRYYRNSIQYGLEDTISYTNFWKPLNSETVKDAEKIYLSLDGIYNNININTLFNPATRKFILDEHTIHTLSNTKDIIDIKKKATSVGDIKSNTALFFGFPDYNFIVSEKPVVTASSTKNGETKLTRELHTRGDFRSAFRGGVISELPGTKEEVDGISTLYQKLGNTSTKKTLGKDATESSIKDLTTAPKVLHIATHGFFMADVKKTSQKGLVDEGADNPLLQSGLLLTGASKAYSEEVVLNQIEGMLNGKKVDDGILSAYEALNMNLFGTSLVVLSACETGLGEVVNGEGVFGLQRSFMTAGAETVVMSMWKVYDESTNKLMRYFYEEFLNTGDKRTAFIKAQQKLRLEHPTPVHWGAFVMIGE